MFSFHDKKRLFFLFLFVISLLISSCGRKGDPTLRSFEKPLPVKNLTAVHREDKVIISWDYPSSERDKIKGFYVERAETASNFTAPPLSFLNNDVSAYTDKEFKLKTEYFYKIRVYSLRDVISDDSPVVKVRPLPLYDPPTGLSYLLTNGAVKIQWDRLCNLIRYNVYKSYQKGKYSAPLNKAPLGDDFISDRIDTKRPVYYTVRALHDTEVMDEGRPSDELEVSPDSFVPSNPTVLKFVIGEDRVYLMWNENNEAWLSGYKVYRKRASDPEFKMIGETVTPAFVDKDKLDSTTYYRVTALGPKKESIPSEHVIVEPLKSD